VWTPEDIARIQQLGRYNIAREGLAANDGRKAVLHPQTVDPFFAQSDVQPFGNLTQGHMHTGATRHLLKVRVKGEEMGISPPWDEVTIADPRLPLVIDTRNRLAQAPPLLPTEFRTWEFNPTPPEANRGRR